MLATDTTKARIHSPIRPHFWLFGSELRLVDKCCDIDTVVTNFLERCALRDIRRLFVPSYPRSRDAWLELFESTPHVTERSVLHCAIRCEGLPPRFLNKARDSGEPLRLRPS